MWRSTLYSSVSFFLLHDKNGTLCLVGTIVAHTSEEKPAVTVAKITSVGDGETLR
jgi:hypothetical protein